MAAAAHPWILAPWSCCCFPASATCSSPVLSPTFPPLLSTGTGKFQLPWIQICLQSPPRDPSAPVCRDVPPVEIHIIPVWRYSSEDPSTKFSCCHHCIYPKALPGNAAHGISSLSHINMEYSFKSAFFLQFLPPSTSRGKRELNLTSALHFVFIPYTKLCPQASLMPIWGFSQTLKKLPLGDSELEILIKAIYKPGQ